MRVKNNIAVTSFKFILVDVVGDFLRWPFWWYTKGLVDAGLFCLNHVRNEYQALALGVWLKNIFVPMFGQYDLEGRIISFFARLVQIVFRSIILAFWAIVMLILFILWVVAPIYIFYQISNNLLYLTGYGFR